MERRTERRKCCSNQWRPTCRKELYRKGIRSKRMELDFLIAKDTITSKHNISPIEVKSTNRYTLTSLKKCIAKYGSYLAEPYVLHTADLKVEEGITYLPLYMTGLL